MQMIASTEHSYYMCSTLTVFDIRESFPLLDVMEVINDKDGLRFDKFTNKETLGSYILKTNFFYSGKMQIETLGKLREQ